MLARGRANVGSPTGRVPEEAVHERGDESFRGLFLVYGVGLMAAGYWGIRSSPRPDRYRAYALLICGCGCIVVAGGYMLAEAETASSIRGIAWSITVLVVLPLEVAFVLAKRRRKLIEPQELSPDRYILYLGLVCVGAFIVSVAGRRVVGTPLTVALIDSIAWGIAASVGIGLLITYRRAARAEVLITYRRAVRAGVLSTYRRAKQEISELN